MEGKMVYQETEFSAWCRGEMRKLPEANADRRYLERGGYDLDSGKRSKYSNEEDELNIEKFYENFFRQDPFRKDRVIRLSMSFNLSEDEVHDLLKINIKKKNHDNHNYKSSCRQLGIKPDPDFP